LFPDRNGSVFVCVAENLWMHSVFSWSNASSHGRVLFGMTMYHTIRLPELLDRSRNQPVLGFWPRFPPVVAYGWISSAKRRLNFAGKSMRQNGVPNGFFKWKSSHFGQLPTAPSRYVTIMSNSLSLGRFGERLAAFLNFSTLCCHTCVSRWSGTTPHRSSGDLVLSNIFRSTFGNLYGFLEDP